MGLALADHHLDRRGDHAVRRQNSGEKGQVFVPHGPLEGDAGGGNEDGPERLAFARQKPLVRRPGDQIGIGLADTRSGVAQGDISVQHSVQHSVAQGNLFRALRHPLSGE